MAGRLLLGGLIASLCALPHTVGLQDDPSGELQRARELSKQRADLVDQVGRLTSSVDLLEELQKLEDEINAILEGRTQGTQDDIDRLEGRQADILEELKALGWKSGDETEARKQLDETKRKLTALRKRIAELHSLHSREVKVIEQELDRLRAKKIAYAKSLKKLKEVEGQVGKHEKAAREARLQAALDLCLASVEVLMGAVKALQKLGKITLQMAARANSVLELVKAILSGGKAFSQDPKDQETTPHLDATMSGWTARWEDLKAGLSDKDIKTIDPLDKALGTLISVVKTGSKIMDIKNPNAWKVLAELGDGVLSVIAVVGSGPFVALIIGGQILSSTLQAATGLILAVREVSHMRRVIRENLDGQALVESRIKNLSLMITNLKKQRERKLIALSHLEAG
jgi:hypothetical protein